MIKIQTSDTGDTRTCDASKVSKNQLLSSSFQHINDVQRGIDFLGAILHAQGCKHDSDKLSGIDHFHADFITSFKETGWWDNHRKVTRHHLGDDDGVPDDVNLIDVIEMIVDCVMAGMGRSGKVTPLKIGPDVLEKAFQNTVTLIKDQVVVEK
jgi:hypothetical protein